MNYRDHCEEQVIYPVPFFAPNLNTDSFLNSLWNYIDHFNLISKEVPVTTIILIITTIILIITTIIITIITIIKIIIIIIIIVITVIIIMVIIIVIIMSRLKLSCLLLRLARDILQANRS